MPPYPFSAVVGLDDLRLALLLNAVSPAVGGVLVRGEKGTAKSTIVRALAAVLPQIAVVPGCRFSCDPAAPDPACPDGPHAPGAASSQSHPARLVELPVGATEDRLVGSLDLEKVLASGVAAYEPGLLAAAHRGLLYVDEVNLLHDHLVDLLLDAAAMGVAHVEREGVSVRHAARFLLVGTMNPEEGELRPQLLDRFGLTVEVPPAATRPSAPRWCAAAWPTKPTPPGLRRGLGAGEDEETAARIEAARALLPSVTLPDSELLRITRICASFEVDGMRADLVRARAATALARVGGPRRGDAEDVRAGGDAGAAAPPAAHPFDAPGLDEERLDEAMDDGDEDPDPAPAAPDPTTTTPNPPGPRTASDPRADAAPESGPAKSPDQADQADRPDQADQEEAPVASPDQQDSRPGDVKPSRSASERESTAASGPRHPHRALQSPPAPSRRRRHRRRRPPLPRPRLRRPLGRRPPRRARPAPDRDRPRRRAPAGRPRPSRRRSPPALRGPPRADSRGPRGQPRAVRRRRLRLDGRAPADEPPSRAPSSPCCSTPISAVTRSAWSPSAGRGAERRAAADLGRWTPRAARLADAARPAAVPRWPPGSCKPPTSCASSACATRAAVRCSSSSPTAAPRGRPLRRPRSPTPGVPRRICTRPSRGSAARPSSWTASPGRSGSAWPAASRPASAATHVPIDRPRRRRAHRAVHGGRPAPPTGRQPDAAGSPTRCPTTGSPRASAATGRCRRAHRPEQGEVDRRVRDGAARLERRAGRRRCSSSSSRRSGASARRPRSRRSASCTRAPARAGPSSGTRWARAGPGRATGVRRGSRRRGPRGLGGDPAAARGRRATASTSSTSSPTR